MLDIKVMVPNWFEYVNYDLYLIFNVRIIFIEANKIKAIVISYEKKEEKRCI